MDITVTQLLVICGVGSSLLFSWPISRFFPLPKKSLEDKLILLIIGWTIAPILEEGLFRWLPLYFFGLWGLIIGSSLWVVLHRPPQRYIPVACIGMALCILWLQGLGFLAIALHYGINFSVCLLLWFYDKDIREFREIISE